MQRSGSRSGIAEFRDNFDQGPNLIGDGFYGVDLKRIGRRAVVIEVNDNPNVDAGNEDKILKDALYREIMGLMLRRIIARKRLEFDIA
mgnify:CR=1 FL=1